MNTKEFDIILESRIDKIRAILAKKGIEYSIPDDRLMNFKQASRMNDTTAKRECWNFLTKHLVSIQDIVCDRIQYNQETYEEKIGDAINYLILLEAILTEENLKWK